MCDFGDPGDLGFFFEEPEAEVYDAPLGDDFYEGASGEDLEHLARYRSDSVSIVENPDGTASFRGVLIGMGF